MKSVLSFKKAKVNQQKISVITCYDYSFANIINRTNIDCILVGDSGGMALLGKENTTYTTLADMQFMTKAVSRGAKDKLIIADLPFMSYRQSLEVTMQSVATLIQSGAHAVKLEGCTGNLDTIKHIVASGIPVIAHIGLAPQFINGLGGYKIQGKTEDAAKTLINEAKQLQEAGCFAIVLECIPDKVAKQITLSLNIPTIGIGAGSSTDGQVIVLQDMLGMNMDFQPKFVKKYADLSQLLLKAINTYSEETKAGIFPSKEHSYDYS
ncbi:3-methyl-2-oxobutanoate hydroxymethyltransferase [Francisella halioticida]|uniref:3-methyl-2-oxobutanoate hydroxymethyltransferase n=1 Tax=Francisella halioticida TaxID=549298 RepID=A0ABM6LZF8_9GAMM|nr:3-methyl-2-oxobutanoate hydroxymethyltransferase [Francisella halioticida]ASG67836.1 3-methyl-2-oxobutanoate hydroxymethyltransferase [Francisella halioticida]BCD90693.1 3-methyl-2-oxobutanoate hydroxymethyltransferase [Francisella halioticida]